MDVFYGFWLLFDEKTNNKLTPIISRLSATYSNGNIFVPHLSVYSAVNTTISDSTMAIGHAVKNSEPFDVSVEKVSYTPGKWSQTLFLQIKPHPTITKISTNLANYFAGSYELFPHVSLVYSDKMTEAEKLYEIANLEIPQTLTISTIGIVNPHSSDNNWHDFGKWTIDEQVKLYK